MEKRIHTDLKDAFTMLPEMHLENLEETRAEHDELLVIESPVNDALTITDRFVPGPPGAPDVRVRIYGPKDKTGILAGLLWIHGGGYVLGKPEMNDVLCQRFVLEAKCVVVSVDYRLAPEHPFPAPVEDCYAALKWFAKNAGEFNVDPARIGVAGQSAGGGLTAAVSLMARDRQEPVIAFQMPLYPMIDPANKSASSYEITDARVWNRSKNLLAWKAYLGKEFDGEVSPYAAPILADDFSNLPPTYTCVGDLDPFRDETIEYVTQLSRAGVPVEFHLYPGCFHGFESLAAEAEISRKATDQYVFAFKRAVQLKEEFKEV